VQLSVIGRPVTDPHVADLCLAYGQATEFAALEEHATETLHAELARLHEIRSRN
jgi:hypothetical protein